MLYLKIKIIKKPRFEFFFAPTETSQEFSDISYNLCHLAYGVNLYRSHLLKQKECDSPLPLSAS